MNPAAGARKYSHFARCGLLIVGAAFWAMLQIPALAFAADAAVIATVTPGEVSLSPGASAAGVLTVANNSDKFFHLSLRAVSSNPSVAIQFSRPNIALHGSESISVDFAVTRKMEDLGQDVTVAFLVNGFRTSTVATLVIKAIATPSIIDAKVNSNVDQIDENRSGSAILIVSNPRETPVVVNSISVTAPASVTVTVGCPGRKSAVSAKDGQTSVGPGCQFIVEARKQQVLPVTLSASNAVVPGSRSATFRLDAGGGVEAASVVTTMSFTVAVFGDDILKSLGVPVFLVLPGVLIVLTAWFLISRVTPWRRYSVADDGGTVVGAATRTAVLGVAISLLVASVYPTLTESVFPGYRRDYLHAYGFVDFYFVFIYSFIIAMACWLLSWCAYGGRCLFQLVFVPTSGDGPNVLLRKMAMRSLIRGEAKYPHVNLDGKAGVILDGQFPAPVTVAPRIVLTKTDGLDKAMIQDLIDEGRIMKLWSSLRSSISVGRVALSYKGGDIDGVCRTSQNQQAVLNGQTVTLVELP